jgi:hypothetical protein
MGRGHGVHLQAARAYSKVNEVSGSLDPKCHPVREGTDRAPLRSSGQRWSRVLEVQPDASQVSAGIPSFSPGVGRLLATTLGQHT